MRDVVIVAGCRTPIGTIGGQFKTLAPVELTIPVMQNLIKRSGIDPVIIDYRMDSCSFASFGRKTNPVPYFPFSGTGIPCRQCEATRIFR